MIFSGKAYKYGDNVNTDVIIPARYLNDATEANLKAHAMEDIDSSFAATVKDGDVVVGGFNFGCGSSREHAPLALKAAGVKLVVAKTFARIFFRNAINVGLMLFESETAANEIGVGDALAIDGCNLVDTTNGKSFDMPKSDEYVQKIIENGGLINMLKAENNK